jgi:DNA-binding transcriptional MerR regulator
MYKVQEVAKIAGVSVRTLHHYDSIGLLKPSNIGSNRYRYYNDEDLKLLQNILFFKELGFPLKKIQEIAAEGLDEHYALTQHIKFLEMKKARLEKLIENAELTQREYEGTETLSNEQRFSAFSAKKSEENIKQYIKPVNPHEETAEWNNREKPPLLSFQ